jgi:serine/threonine-protein kinase
MSTFTGVLGERFGSFKTLARLGEGSMGEVYLAEHQRIARRAAIKVLMAERTRDADTVRRLFVEARATSMIRHPGIVEIYDCDVHRNGRAYIVMEYLEGETLAKRLERLGALPWQVACRIARRATDAIGAAHRVGIVHRDVKPDNVFLLSDSAWPAITDVKVLDFGLAKLVAGNLVGVAGTMAGSLVGSPTYMSPEQCQGEKVDHRCDIYSLGCVIFEMIAGRPPFVGSRVREVLEAHTLRAPPALGSVAPQVPPWLTRLVGRMLAKDPRQRPRAMDEVSIELGVVDLAPPVEVAREMQAQVPATAPAPQRVDGTFRR